MVQTELGEREMASQNVEGLIKEAQEAESCGFVEVACDKYRQGARELIRLSELATDPNEVSAYTLQAGDYLARCSELTKEGAAAAQAVEADLEQDDATSLRSTPMEVEEEFTDEEIKKGAAVMGSAMGAGAGTFIGMPLIGGVAGFFAARHYVEQDTEYGARARSLGVTGARFLNKFNKLGRDTQAKQVAGQALESTRAFGEKAWESTKSFNEKHDLTGKAKNAAASLVETVNDMEITKKAKEKLNGLTAGESDEEKKEPMISPQEDGEGSYQPPSTN